MTADHGSDCSTAPDATTEQDETARGHVTTHTCYAIDCSDCGGDCWEEGTPHFGSEAELWNSLLGEDGYGWTRDHGRPLCRHCLKRADCVRDGHQHVPWSTRHDDAGIAWRYCEHCGGGFEERFVEMLEDPPRPF